MPDDPKPECRTQIFSEGDFLKGTLTWGWQCFTCGAEETGLTTATTAGEHAEEHGTRF